jgi:hypothetical protein
MNPFCAQNLKTNYNVMPYGDYGTERVKIVILLTTYKQSFIGRQPGGGWHYIFTQWWASHVLTHRKSLGVLQVSCIVVVR